MAEEVARTVWRWIRRSDGIEVVTRPRHPHENDHEQALVTRLDNRRQYWVSWRGLQLKYQFLAIDLGDV